MKVTIALKNTFLTGSALVALSLAGCSLDTSLFQDLTGPSSKPQSTEALLEAQGSWSLIEDKNGPTPFQQHLNARSHVDPTQTASGSYVPEFRTATQNEQDIHYRLLRMERAVDGLRRDLNKLLPPLSSLIVSDIKLDRVIREITTQPGGGADESLPLQHGHGFVPAMPSAPIPVQKFSAPAVNAGAVMPKKSFPQMRPKPRETAMSMPEKYAGGPPNVTQVRTGAHPDKTRMVLDINAPAQFRYDLDNNEKLLLIDLPGINWSAPRQQKLARNPLVSGYTAQASGDGGTMLVVELKQPAKVLRSKALPPNDRYGHRIYFDIAPL